jgi:hypothetical protein
LRSAKIDPEHRRRRADLGFGEGGDQAQQRHRVHGDPQHAS